MNKTQKQLLRRTLRGLDEFRHVEVIGRNVHYRPHQNRLIVDSGFNKDGVMLDISTAPMNGETWPNAVTMSAEEWERLAKKVSKIIRFCRSEAKRQYGWSGGKKKQKQKRKRGRL